MINNFESSVFFKGILREEFGLKEIQIEWDDGILSLWKHPIYKRLISTPFRDRIAFQSHTPNTPPKIQNLPSKLLKSSQVYLKDVKPDRGTLNSTSIVTPFVNSDILLDEDLEKRFKHSTRKNFRKAENYYGLTLEINPNDALNSFYHLYLKTRKRIGVLPYPKTFFKKLLKGSEENKTILLTCHHKGKAIGYLLCYLNETEMISGHIAYDFNLKNLRITDFLFCKALTWGRNNGYQNYRFGADYEVQKSLIKFKEKFGAITRTQYDWHKGKYKLFNSESSPNQSVRMIIGKTPPLLFRLYSNLTKLYFH